MNCLKCGKDTKGEQVFCDTCLEHMDAYPVRSDAPIHLPNRITTPAVAKKAPSRKKALPAEEVIQQLKTANRRLIWAVLALILALGLCASGLAYHLLHPQQANEEAVTSGKNYTYSPN